MFIENSVPNTAIVALVYPKSKTIFYPSHNIMIFGFWANTW